MHMTFWEYPKFGFLCRSENNNKEIPESVLALKYVAKGYSIFVVHAYWKC